MSRDPWAPKSGKEWEQARAAASEEGPTDFASLMSATAVSAQPRPVRREAEATDFASIRHVLTPAAETPPRTWNDTLLDVLTPLMILTMVYSVVYFLLDVRYVYTAVHDANLRFVAFSFVLGVVALNRLIARDGSRESYLYMGGLAGAIALYTFSTTEMYGVGSVARNFMNDNPYLATLFNMMVVVFVWWLVNRLTHECCVDENRSAGEVGILTGAARRWQARLKAEPRAKAQSRPLKPVGVSDPWLELEPFDPTEGYTRPDTEETAMPAASLADRWGEKHPGMAVLYFSVPVFVIFALGLRVIQHGGEAWVRAGAVYMGVYTAAALSLLMLSSLSHLREYFRARKVRMPEGIAWFWIGLGLVQIAVVMVAAAQLPLPELPPLAHVDTHQTDPWARGGPKFELSTVARTQMELLEQAQFVERIGQAVLAVLGLVFGFGLLKAIGAWAAHMARQRDRYPKVLTRFFDGLEKAVEKLTRLPQPMPRRRRVRIQRNLATSTPFRSSLGQEATRGWSTRQHIEHAYAALCALAYDLGVPRAAGQTPYEFLRRFPAELGSLEEEAEELTRLYVMAAYSSLTMDARLEDRLRKFWMGYERVRRRYVK